jgi:hypothetical protein
MIYQDPKTASFAVPIIAIPRAMARAAFDLANRPGFRQQGRIFVEVQQPAIARIAEEVPAGTRLQAIIEVDDEMVEQPLFSAGHSTCVGGIAPLVVCEHEVDVSPLSLALPRQELNPVVAHWLARIDDSRPIRTLRRWRQT